MSQPQTQSTPVGPASVTVVGPLTTPFTPSPECLAGLTIASRYLDPKDTETFYVTMGLNMLTSGAVATQCLPSAYLSALRADQSTQPVMSPGSICPVGYGPSCTIVGKGASIVAATDVIVWNALSSTQTAIGCCPSHYACAQETLYKCTSTPGIGETEISAAETEILFSTTIASKTIDNTISSFKTETSYTKTWMGNVYLQTNIKVVASAVQVIYIQDEKPPAAINHTGNGVSSTSPASEANSTSHLPPSTIIAIIVPIATLALIAVGIFLYFRRRRRNRAVPEPDEGYGKAELDTTSAVLHAHQKDIKELHGENIYSNSHGIRELDGKLKDRAIYSHELDGDQRCELYEEQGYIAELDATEYFPHGRQPHGVTASRVDEGGWI